jgi:16S rRNA (cytosine967-C5)-methyltransferase
MRTVEKQTGNPRAAALEVLLRCARQGAWSDGALKDAAKGYALSGRDSALCSRICYGVQQNLLLLDFWLAGWSSVPLAKMELPLLSALRMGLYQIVFLDRVPDSAAVNETVKLCHTACKNPHSAKVANGILRTACRQKETLPQPDSLSVRYSHPQWLVDLFAQELQGVGVEALLQANNAQPHTTVQTNTLLLDGESLRQELAEAGVEALPHPWLPDCLELRGTGALEELEPFQDGDFYVQDAAAKLAVLAADPQPGMAVLDCCAAPGGKTFAAAIQMGDRGSITACDIHAGKVKLVAQGARRLGLTTVTTQPCNAREFQPEWAERFDLVLADVPCSGLGIIRKKPDIRYKEPQPLENLPKVQGDILENVSRYVKAGGALLYATCTVLRRENQAVVEDFLSRHPEYRLEAFALPQLGQVEAGMVTLWPHLHGTDGFFIAKLRRREEPL